MANIRTDDWYL